MNDTKHLKQEIEDQARQIEKAERERQTVLSQTVFIGTLGLLMALPVVAGAYLGNWLDGFSADHYSVRWTLGMIFLGVFIGSVNIYLFIRSH